MYNLSHAIGDLGNNNWKRNAQDAMLKYMGTDFQAAVIVPRGGACDPICKPRIQRGERMGRQAAVGTSGCRASGFLMCENS
jgi:hypothetical protein